MNRVISWGEVRLGLRLILKQPVLSATIILALATAVVCVVVFWWALQVQFPLLHGFIR